MRRVILFSVFVLLLAALALVYAETPTPEPTPDVPAELSTEGATPTDRQPMAKKIELVCPVDGETVTGWEIAAFHTAGVDTDFCYLGASESFYQKLIFTCPKCGYTGYREDFPPHLTKLPAKVVKKIKKKIPKLVNLEKLEPWDRYAILAQIYIWRDKPNKDIGNAYVRATYTMRGLALGRNEIKQERWLREQAIKYLIKASRRGEFPLNEVPQVKYLIADLLRRNRHFKKAISYYQDAAKLKNRPEWLDEMIIRQMARAHAYDDS